MCATALICKYKFQDPLTLFKPWNINPVTCSYFEDVLNTSLIFKSSKKWSLAEFCDLFLLKK